MSLLSIINSVLRCTIRYFRHETALFSARMLESHSYSIAGTGWRPRDGVIDGGAYGIPAPRCRVTYNVGHGDAWVSALGFAHRRAPAPPIRSIYRLRRSVPYTVYGTAVDERDATVTGTVLLCAPGLYTIHCIHLSLIHISEPTRPY